MHHQPLLVVLRAEEPLTLCQRLLGLERIGVRHVEIAWSRHPAWAEQVRELQRRCPGLQLGAASITAAEGLRAVAAAGLGYAMAPMLDPALQALAQECGVVLVPGVFSPTEVHGAMALGCPLVKLFPAATLGPAHWQRLRQPLGPLPFCIAAGGLAVGDMDAWLGAGVDAVTLGASVADGEGLRELEAWIRSRRSPL